MSDIQIDVEAANPLATVEAQPIKVEEAEVVFVPFEDTELRINQMTKRFKKGVSTKINRDEARVLIEASKGYIKD
jgi:hypothetical protein